MMNDQLKELDEIAKQLKTQPGAGRVEKAIDGLLEEKRALEKELSRLKSKLAASQGSDLSALAVDVKGAKVLAATLDGADSKTLRETMDRLKEELKSAAVGLGAVEDEQGTRRAGVPAD